MTQQQQQASWTPHAPWWQHQPPPSWGASAWTNALATSSGFSGTLPQTNWNPEVHPMFQAHMSIGYGSSSNHIEMGHESQQYYAATAVDCQTTETNTQRELDQQFVTSFVERLSKNSLGVKTSAETRNSFTVMEARLLLKQCLEMINQLKTFHDKLSSNIEVDEPSWYLLAEEACNKKNELQCLLDRLTNSEKLRNLEHRVKRIRKKRERLRRQKQRLREEKSENEKESKLLHETLDAWLESLRHDYLKQQMEKKLKKEADAILSEVRRKKAEANKVLDLVKAVSKLRDAKKQTAKTKGLYSSVESDVVFAKTTKKFEDELGLRLQDYGEEEKTLQVMLDVEHQETRDLEVRRQRQEEQEKINAVKADVIHSLFGPEVVDKHDLRFPYWEYHTRSERDLDTLLCIRSEWDMWLVAEGTPNSSSVPVGWVIPPEPSSEAWAATLLERQ